MTCLFGCICNQPEQLSRSLDAVRSVLVAGAPVARWGMGYVQGDDVLLSRNPRQQAGNVDFYAAMASLRADYLIAHASAPDRLTGNPNTQPFRYRKWMFAQEDSAQGEPIDDAIDDIGPVQAALLEDVPEFIRRNVKGKTLAEHIFHVFLASLHEIGDLDDANFPTDRLHEALAAALTRTKQVLARMEIGHEPGNLMLSNGRLFLAARQGQPLYMRRLVVPGPEAPHRDEAFRGILVVSAAATPGEGFEEIPPHSVLLISRDVRTDISPLRT